LWKAVGNNLNSYAGFPRMVGECGGKNFHFVHTAANVDAVVAGTVRSGANAMI
jgi:1-pyrroline-5-carboxylate dehydrogenase